MATGEKLGNVAVKLGKIIVAMGKIAEKLGVPTGPVRTALPPVGTRAFPLQKHRKKGDGHRPIGDGARRFEDGASAIGKSPEKSQCGRKPASLGYKISPVRARTFHAMAFTETSDCCPDAHGVRNEFSKRDGGRQEKSFFARYDFATRLRRLILICFSVFQPFSICG